MIKKVYQVDARWRLSDRGRKEEKVKKRKERENVVSLSGLRKKGLPPFFFVISL